MERQFIYTKEFDKAWSRLGLTDKELMSLEKTILNDPKCAPAIQGTGGIRKLRFALGGRGKSGSLRILYIDIDTIQIVFFLSLFEKSDKENLTDQEKQQMLSITTQLKQIYKK